MVYVLTTWTQRFDAEDHEPDRVDVKVHVFKSEQAAQDTATRNYDKWKLDIEDYYNSIDEDGSCFEKIITSVSRWGICGCFDYGSVSRWFNATVEEITVK